jgi:hypothetical protein
MEMLSKELDKLYSMQKLKVRLEILSKLTAKNAKALSYL